MNLQTFRGNDPAWALFAARLCGRAYDSENRLGLDAAMELLCGDNTETNTVALRNGVPGAIRGTGQDGYCIAVSGITALSQAGAIDQSFTALFLNRSTRFFGQWFYDGALSLMRSFRLAQLAPGRPCYFFGHSGGAGIALALAQITKELLPRNEVHVVTFGGPRCCSDSGLSLLNDVEITRWMNTGDDVVRLPPRYTDLTDVAFLAALPVLPQWARFVHSRGGLVLDVMGNVSPGILPDPTRLLATITFPSSYLQNGTLFGTPHSIAEYCRRLSLAIPPKILVGKQKFQGPFDLVNLPDMFQALTIEVPQNFAVARPSGLEFTNPPIVLAEQITRRELYIEQPIKRC